jgi:hypothetical protein
MAAGATDETLLNVGQPEIIGPTQHSQILCDTKQRLTYVSEPNFCVICYVSV